MIRNEIIDFDFWVHFLGGRAWNIPIFCKKILLWFAHKSIIFWKIFWVLYCRLFSWCKKRHSRDPSNVVIAKCMNSKLHMYFRGFFKRTKLKPDKYKWFVIWGDNWQSINDPLNRICWEMTQNFLPKGHLSNPNFSHDCVRN